MTFNGTATGQAPVVPTRSGVAVGATGWTGAATGRRVSRAYVAGDVLWAGAAAGQAPVVPGDGVPALDPRLTHSTTPPTLVHAGQVAPTLTLSSQQPLLTETT